MDFEGGRLQMWSVLFTMWYYQHALSLLKLTFDHLTEVVFVSLCHSQVTLFLTLHIILLLFLVCVCNSCLSNNSYTTSLRDKLPILTIWKSSVWEFVLFSQAYSIIYLSQYGLIDINFVLWDISSKDDLTDYIANLVIV